MIKLKNVYLPVFIAFSLIIFSPSSYAQEVVVMPANGDLLPVMSGNNENAGIVEPQRFTDFPDLRITSDKPIIVKLDADASNIIVGNTDHVGVLPDNPRNLVMIPRQPGSTYLQVLDVNGDVIMQRHVIVGVAKPKENYIRVRRSCTGQEDCEQYSMYYCPGMCHEMSVSSNRGATVTETNGSPVRNEVNIENNTANPTLNSTEQGLRELPVEDNFNAGNGVGVSR